MGKSYHGTCSCGSVAIEATGEPVDMGYCHCAACRAYSGGPVAGFTLWKEEAVTITKGTESLGGFQSSGFSNRRFCTHCGSGVMNEHPSLGLIDISAGRLPTLAFRPTVHLNYEETVLPMRDGLPKLKDFPAEVGGSGETMPE